MEKEWQISTNETQYSKDLIKNYDLKIKGNTDEKGITSRKAYNRNEQDLEIKTYVKILICLDEFVVSKSNKKVNISEKEEKRISTLYQSIIEKAIKIGEIQKPVLIYSLALAKKSARSIKKICEFTRGQFYSVYSSCLFLSLKLVIDYELWLVSDFCCICGLNEKELRELEVNLFTYILDYRAIVQPLSYQKQEEKFAFLLEKVRANG